MNIEEA
ncbi:Protein of unknown function [Lactobacillus acidophilus DSM 9126]|nr:Protein of unknown function [Lactobacillus acidophilus DSM 20079 = JCM 1132 = NBRC 13951 = CIP 76.13]CDF70224.1 Protein of unknown function [Lactobacillus acidophilus CIRM-BIA 442]CDF72019.1 Protein of unknown function [Lactobacillus acidophilus CIRM-BIA 445]CDF73841.1 Protein of unknown function [Lactobacillus acidophilus DSM 9126]CDF75844.1 Protein of unknown function [Lactobacillus acidophilus DSM 20242]